MGWFNKKTETPTTDETGEVLPAETRKSKPAEKRPRRFSRPFVIRKAPNVRQHN